MAVFTTQLGSLVENGFDIGLNSYPIYDEAYRATLNNLIIEHFYFREIAFETAQLFKRFLNRKMNEIMPYYNQMYKSQLLEFKPLTNYDFQETTDRTINQNTTSDTKVNATSNQQDTSTSRSLYSATPQIQLSGSEDYATNLTDATSNATSDGVRKEDNNVTGNNDTLDSYVRKLAGYSGITPASMLMEYRESIINVNLMVFAELEPLFMQIWSDEVNAF